jgi:hypothetical protein
MTMVERLEHLGGLPLAAALGLVLSATSADAAEVWVRWVTQEKIEHGRSTWTFTYSPSTEPAYPTRAECEREGARIEEFVATHMSGTTTRRGRATWVETSPGYQLLFVWQCIPTTR